MDVKFSVQDEGVYFDNIWGYKGNTFRPDFDAYYWQWDGYFDPGQTLTCFTTDQIEGWNEFSWSNAEYDRLDTLQTDRDGREQARRVHPRDAGGHVRGRAVHHDRATRTSCWPTARTSGTAGRARGYGEGPPFVTEALPWAYYST